MFSLYCNLASLLDDLDITEENIYEVLKLNDSIEQLQNVIELVKNEKYIPFLKGFLSTLTISCFSTSGWDNQLMWAHYANSYSGICIEYDFSKIKDFIGFIYPVNYSNERATISLHDLGISKLERNEDEVTVVNSDVNVRAIIDYLLVKNKCWDYEKEWRIINIGEANTPVFIDIPFIKSITFGINIDDISKRLLLDICKTKNIECYELVINTDSFELQRELIDLSKVEYNEDEELAFNREVSNAILKYADKIDSEEQFLGNIVTDDGFDYEKFSSCLAEFVEIMLAAYHYKTSFNRIIKNTLEDTSILKDDEGVKSAIDGVNELVEESEKCYKAINDNLDKIRFNFIIPNKYYNRILKHSNDLHELAKAISNIDWAEL